MIGSLAWIAALALAPVAHLEDPKAANPLDAFQGTWISVDESGQSTWTFEGNRLTLKTPTREYKILITLGQEDQLATIDLEATADSPEAPGYKAPGIYKFENGKLLICFGDDQTGRPKQFVNNFPMSFLFELTKKPAASKEQ
ncbi:MAG: hypothetical protein KatS3mg108_0423 [Isosphaeraceae bacterium]|jgi:uncharacterized protein (TIGR03067 family)|nr:MAG: hypothetical protein KatS3mg108_0423 [Isosphaeraceae bacterium]